MKREEDGQRLLHRLLDRHERNPQSSRRIIEHPTLSFVSAGERQALTQALEAARDAGGVTLGFDRDASHLIASVVLVDADRLYAHLARAPASISMAAAVAKLTAFEPTTTIGKALREHFAAGWVDGKAPLMLGPARAEEAIGLLRAADAVFTDLADARVPLRTRSARLLGDSKALERAIPKLLAFLKQVGQIAPDLTRDEALRVLGLEKFPQPVLLAGPVVVDGARLERWTYAGLPPEAAQHIDLTGPLASILTIENLESFNRHVRECREPADLVVYTGGFPSPAVIAILVRLIEQSAISSIWHWGDIDLGGIRIGCYLESVLPVPVRPHLMGVALALEHGTPAPHSADPLKVAPSSGFFELATFLAGPDTCWLEQEVLDPESVSHCS